MIIVMQKHADESAVENVIKVIRSRGLQEHVSRGEERTIIGAVGDERVFHPHEIENLPQVERAIRVLSDWRIISRETQPEDSMIAVRGVVFGGGKMLDIATDTVRLDRADAVLTDPFYLPSRPYADCHGQAASSESVQIREMQTLVRNVHATGKPIMVRIRDVRQIEPALAAEADILYLGGELMSNRALQDEVGRLNTPVVLCKDKHHRVDEWLIAAEHIALRGNHHIILGEAGTLSFEPEHTYRLDVDAVVRARKVSHLPVIANITRLWHGDMPQEVLYRLAQAAGANGVISSLP
ncbi:chorismate mutase [Neisseria weaveri]|uniref:Chorismate mutase-related protein n=1 Tax=Neisseria weaveri TaxID=28091 RepID=A0A448VJ28_9NEIS|nr:chorismate mutase [Neisseria weaveri]EGV37055.1 DAHP synthetase family, class I [Neisseria weaveri LMG 5135]VEJ49754.1 Chorismate mutase-related protein [Neisseria weaveri]